MISLKELIMKYNNICFYCGKPIVGKLKPTRDHVYPKSKGGENGKANIVLSCHKCNSSKKDNLLSEFLTEVNRKKRKSCIKGINRKNRPRKKKFKTDKQKKLTIYKEMGEDFING